MLGATAGMRLLTQSDQQAIMAKIRELLRVSGFLFYSDSWCRILTGPEEGAAMWFSINYLLDHIWPDQVKDMKTVAIVDLGGASTQIAFAIEEPCAHSNLNVEINIP